MLKRKVSSIMLPLSEYAVVDCDATLADAVAVLDEAQAELAAGRQPHRAVLVKDKNGTIVGKLGHLSFLRALLPERRTWNNNEMLDRAGVRDEMIESSAGMFELLSEEIMDVCAKVKSLRVSEVCTPATASIDHEAFLLDAIRAFLTHNTLSLLVTDRGRTVGILRLADLYDEFARLVKSGECDQE
jgi:predicted transcriptional regulator